MYPDYRQILVVQQYCSVQAYSNFEPALVQPFSILYDKLSLNLEQNKRGQRLIYLFTNKMVCIFYILIYVLYRFSNVKKIRIGFKYSTIDWSWSALWSIGCRIFHPIDCTSLFKIKQIKKCKRILRNNFLKFKIGSHGASTIRYVRKNSRLIKRHYFPRGIWDALSRCTENVAGYIFCYCKIQNIKIWQTGCLKL